ncbi:hypothetical protein D918_06929 [Trichuris suis]|nr:hypothetical protein D918_06929 [Trichuris suis]
MRQATEVVDEESTSKLLVTSRQQALLVKHVNVQLYRLIFDRNMLTSVGPKKPTPAFTKAGRKLAILQLVKSAIRSSHGLTESFLQYRQPFRTALVALRALRIQNSLQHPFGPHMHQFQVAVPDDQAQYTSCGGQNYGML